MNQLTHIAVISFISVTASLKSYNKSPGIDVVSKTDYIIHHFGGLCVEFVNHIVATLTLVCKETFLYANNRLKSVSSGKCMIPVEINDTTFLNLTCDCSDSNAFFELTDKHSIKHLKSGKCLQPSDGGPRPKEKSSLILRHGCGGSPQRFYLENSFQKQLNTQYLSQL